MQGPFQVRGAYLCFSVIPVMSCNAKMFMPGRERKGNQSVPGSTEDHLHNLMLLSRDPDTITWSDG